MEWLSYLATILGLTLPLAIGFVVIGVIIVGLGILGAELYTENDTKKRLRPRDADGSTPRKRRNYSANRL